MVSRYVTPVTSSFTMQLALILEIPGVTTSPMGMVPMGASRSTSTSSGICKQAVTPKKPCGRVGGHTSTNAWDGKEGLGGVGVPGREAGRPYGYHLGELMGSYFWPRGLGWLGDLPGGHHWLGWVEYFLPSQKLQGSLFQSSLQCMVCLGDVCSKKGLQTLLLFFLGEGHPLEDLLIGEGEVPLHLLPQLQNTFR